MCGISGLICPGGADISAMQNALAAALQALAHRGPDGQGRYCDGKVGFGHNRLSILDLSELGSQPMTSASGDLVMTYNGEVYNFRDIAAELGLVLKSGSDTEVILEGFARLGPALFARLNGMFAFALHDKRENCVWIVRDRLGIKPLFLCSDDRSLAFCSEIKGILALMPGLVPQIDTGSLHEWAYYGNALGPRTLYKGIRQLLPGHALRIDLATGAQREECYWSLLDAAATARRKPFANPQEMVAETRAVLEASIRRHLIADVPVGVFLSGGIDSSAIATLASRMSSEPLATFSAAFDADTENSELPLAAEVARACGSNHHEIRIHGTNIAETVERMVEAHDQPFGDAANIPLYLLCKEVVATHKVVLQGDAGDEMFAGYGRYQMLQRVARWRWLIRMGAPLRHLMGRSGMAGRVARIIEVLRETDDAELMALLLTVDRRQPGPARIFGPALREAALALDPFARYREIARRLPEGDLADAMLLVDKQIILPDIFFEKVDRSTMAASVEVRVPFADNAVVEHVLRLTADQLMPGGVQKGLLRQAVADLLPASVLAGKKRGFGVPFDKWVAGPLRPLLLDMVQAANARQPGLLDGKAIETLLADHIAGRASNGFLLWKALNFAIWVNRSRVTA